MRGDWASTVPDRLVADGRYGVRLGESVAEAKTELEAAVLRACATDPWLRDRPVTVSWPGGVFASGRLPEGDPLLARMSEAVIDAGVEAGSPSTPPVRGGPYGSDLRQYAAAGVSTVQYGPGDVRYAHAIDEHVAIDEVVHCARAYALLALRLCGAVEDPT